MKINWKARFKNKTFVVSFITLIIGFVYNLLGLLDIVPSVTQDVIMDVVLTIVALLTGLGILVDPTTAGISDTEEVMKKYHEEE